MTQTYSIEGTSGREVWYARVDPDSLATWMYFGQGGGDILTLDFTDVTDVILGYTAGVDSLYDRGGWSYEIFGIQYVELIGGEGRILLAMEGSSVVWIVHGGPADDHLRGGDRGDSLNGGLGPDFIEGNGGNDTLSGGADGGQLLGGEGDDEFWWFGGGDISRGGPGIDTLRLDLMSGVTAVTVDLSTMRGSVSTVSGTVTMRVQEIEVVRGAHDAPNHLTGGAGAETLIGGDGADTLLGGAGDDVLIGGDTTTDLRDVIYGGDGNDSINGGYGNDELRGDDGNDAIEGYFGSDTLIGGTGNDTLSGSALSDQLFGGDNNDFLNGGFGHDRMNGGAGADRFYHLGIANHGSDWVQDYNGAEDTLVFGNAAATRSQFQINYGTTVGAGDGAVQEAFVVYRPTGQVIWALVDGAGQDHIWLQIGANSYDLMA